MIRNDEQLRQAHEALGDLYEVVAGFRSNVLPLNPRNYALLTQGPLEHIRRIQAEIDAYLGLDSVTAKEAEALREKSPPFGEP